jgi:hypothetical protein
MLGNGIEVDSRLFGGTANFLVAREFSQLATYGQKFALMQCLFALATTDEAILMAEEGEIQDNRRSHAWLFLPARVSAHMKSLLPSAEAEWARFTRHLRENLAQAGRGPARGLDSDW